MSEIKVLTLLELRSLYGINRFLHTKDKKAKNRYRLLGFVWLYLICLIFFYVGGQVYGLSMLGMQSVVPAYLVFMATVLILVFGIFKAGNAIFGDKGFDILTSMPIRKSSVVISRFLAMYVEDLLLTLVIMLPGIVMYGVCEKPGIAFYVVALFGMLFVPAIPLVISVILGTLITAISSGVKNKSMVQTILMVAVVVGVLVASFNIGSTAEEFSLAQFAELAGTISSMIGQIYIPALWLGDAMLNYNLVGLLLFVGVSCALMALTIWLVSKNFQGIMLRLRSFTAKHDYKIGEMESKGLTKSLFFREAKRYFSSSIYVTNTIIGPIMGFIMSVALLIVGVDTITNVMPVEIDINGLIPFVIAAVFIMMTTSSCAISMEGKQFGLIKSMPIPAKALFDSKILLNLCLILPFYVLSEICLIIALKPEFMEGIWIILIPALISVFAVVLGITVNIKFRNFEWEREEQVVKQGLSSMLGGFAGMIISLVLGGIAFIVPVEMGNIVKVAICAVLIVGTLLLYKKNNSVRLDTL